MVALSVAFVMLGRINRRNILASSVDPGRLGGAFYDAESGSMVSYRIKRLPVALGASFVAGNVSSLLGLGGGIIKVPVLNAWCGMPMRAAAATSAFMIGVTATGRGDHLLRPWRFATAGCGAGRARRSAGNGVGIAVGAEGVLQLVEDSHGGHSGCGCGRHFVRSIR